MTNLCWGTPVIRAVYFSSIALTYDLNFDDRSLFHSDTLGAGALDFSHKAWCPGVLFCYPPARCFGHIAIELFWYYLGTR